MRVIWYPATTIDGFIADLSGDSDWVTPEDEEYFAVITKGCGAVIVGHNTFRQYRNVIYPMDGVLTFVCTSHAGEPQPGVQYVDGAPQQILDTVEQKGFSEVVLSGGGDTNGRFAAAGLITDVIISVYPKLLGEGIPLLGHHQLRAEFETPESTILGGGVVRFRSNQVSFH